MSSINDKLERVRKPRVHIKYEVETGSGALEKELPFVVGVMGDFSGDHPGHELKPLKDRKFIKIDQDNFDDVMKKITPGIQLNVENTIQNDGSNISCDLKFSSLDDFEPAKLVNQIKRLKELKETRDKLRDLLTKTDRSDQLEHILEETLQDSVALQNLAKQLEIQSES